MPACRFLLETGATHRLVDALEARALDLIVAAEAGLAGEGMEVHPLLDEPFVAAVPRGQGGPGDLPLILYTTRHLMGRQIAAHLARNGPAPGHRFELDSYSAILALVAADEGWTILTPLGWLSAPRFHAAVDLIPLPLPPLTRRIALAARTGILGELPAQIAATLRDLLTERVIGPATRAHPWLAEALRRL
jgi:DNA-binding transcriptional LysR family regulator